MASPDPNHVASLTASVIHWMADPQANAVLYYGALGVTICGLGLWVAGARISRMLITLSLVSIGAAVGLQAPGWMGWHIEGWATAIGAALVLALTGFLLHRFWVGVGLAIVAAAWAGSIFLIVNNGINQYVTPDPATIGPTPRAVAVALWQGIPHDLARQLPVAAGMAGAIALVMAMVWPRAGVALLYSWLGASLMAGGGMIAVHHWRPQWLAHLPPQEARRAMIFAAVVLVGAVVQWRFTPRRKAAPSSRAPGQRMPVVIDI